ncbi:hypothetical protein [Eisenbergiella sp.]
MEHKNRQGRKKGAWRAVRIGIAVLIFLAIVLFFLNGARRLRSDSPGVEWNQEDGRITRVIIDGQFPYCNIIPDVTEKSIVDSEGNVTELTRTYAFDAGFSLRMQGTYKIDIEAADDIVFTYILKFADRDVVIKNGREAE